MYRSTSVIGSFYSIDSFLFLQLDWRPLLPRLAIPCLNLVGALSGVFPLEGTLAVGELIPNCHSVCLFPTTNDYPPSKM